MQFGNVSAKKYRFLERKKKVINGTFVETSEWGVEALTKKN